MMTYKYSIVDIINNENILSQESHIYAGRTIGTYTERYLLC